MERNRAWEWIPNDGMIPSSSVSFLTDVASVTNQPLLLLQFLIYFILLIYAPESRGQGASPGGEAPIRAKHSQSSFLLLALRASDCYSVLKTECCYPLGPWGGVATCGPVPSRGTQNQDVSKLPFLVLFSVQGNLQMTVD